MTSENLNINGVLKVSDISSIGELNSPGGKMLSVILKNVYHNTPGSVDFFVHITNEQLIETGKDKEKMKVLAIEEINKRLHWNYNYGMGCNIHI